METELQRLGDNFAGLGKYFIHQEGPEVIVALHPLSLFASLFFIKTQE